MNLVHSLTQWNQTATAEMKGKMALMAKKLRQKHQAPDESSAIVQPMESNCDKSQETRDGSDGEETAVSR